MNASVITKISFFQNDRSDGSNQELARQLALTRDAVGIQEIADNLWDKNPNIQSDCLKVLYEIGYLDPELIAGFAEDFLKLIHSKNNRLVWGGMIALSTIANLRADDIWSQVDSVKRVVENGSVITVDRGVITLAKVASTSPERRARIFPFLRQILRTCIPRDLPKHAENMLCAVDENDKLEFLTILDARQTELTPSQAARLKKLKKALP